MLAVVLVGLTGELGGRGGGRTGVGKKGGVRASSLAVVGCDETGALAVAGKSSTEQPVRSALTPFLFRAWLALERSREHMRLGAGLCVPALLRLAQRERAPSLSPFG
jgi:hypothetical protein